MTLAVHAKGSDKSAVRDSPASSPATPAGVSSDGGAPAPRSRWPLASTALLILATLAFGFVAQVTVVGALQHLTHQRKAYGQFRSDLALGTAPVGQADDDGRLLRLGTPVAILAIPAIGLRQVVEEGTTSGVLRDGPGHRRDTVLPGQAGGSVVFGRQASYGGPFQRLIQLRAGDAIVVTTGQGRSVYRVRGLRRAGDPLPPPLVAGQGSLVLVTAAGPAFLPDGVLRVDAQLISKTQPTPAPVIAPGSLPAAEQVMVGEPTAWFLVVLWSQALLLAAVGFVWLRARWGRWQSWTVGLPLLGALGLAVADQAARLLPNLI